MYQDDMVNEGDGCGGLPRTPKVSVDQTLELKSALRRSTIVKKPEENSIASSTQPFDHSQFSSGNSVQRQYHQYTSYQPPPELPIRGRSRSPGKSLSEGRGRSRSPGKSLSEGRGRGRSRSEGRGRSRSEGRGRSRSEGRGRSSSRTRTRSRSPGRTRRSRSPSANSRPRENTAAVAATATVTSSSGAGSYHLMPLEMDAKELPPPASAIRKKMIRRRSSSLRSKRKNRKDMEEERYEARVALVIQFAMAFFCALIVIAIVLAIGIAIYSDHGYWLIITLCLILMVSLSLSLCCFLNQVLNEEDAPNVNQAHMPKWYKTMRKVIKDEWADFKADWLAMRNENLLLEDEKDSSLVNIRTKSGVKSSEVETTSSVYSSNTQSSNNKPKKRRGKSTLFKLVAKPVAMLSSFRRKRRGRRKLRKGQDDVATVTSFPSTV
ncbi:expressed unknown protein [Seminavis robusta]|uniref:Uncharacterized protein n=1 Tax=Seminavis robusta TaxID=568900 RepID=A0A9N8DP24_9STRA|nr:expressed unknown protein [Seminavis robusta]|eukprot:Sro162_g072780.1 n/a (435) ;mRNA; r:23665-24969